MSFRALVPDIERVLSNAVNDALFSSEQPRKASEIIAHIGDQLLSGRVEAQTQNSMRQVSNDEVEAVQMALQDAVQHIFKLAEDNTDSFSEEEVLAAIARRLRERNAGDRWRLIRTHMKALSEPHTIQREADDAMRQAGGATPRDAARLELATPRGPADRWRDAMSQIVQWQQQQQQKMQQRGQEPF